MTDWDARFMALARHIGEWSKDRSTKVGCVITGSGRRILTVGYNGFPRGVNDFPDSRHERPVKYKWTEHAERNAIYTAVLNGVSLQGSTAYVPFHPCSDCARGLIQSGVKTIAIPRPDEDLSEFDARWSEDFQVSRVMFRESGVRIRFVAP